MVLAYFDYMVKKNTTGMLINITCINDTTVIKTKVNAYIVKKMSKTAYVL